MKGIGMNKKYIVRLTAEEREDLAKLTKKGKTQAYRIKHAHILLAVDADGPNCRTAAPNGPAAIPCLMPWNRGRTETPLDPRATSRPSTLHTHGIWADCRMCRVAWGIGPCEYGAMTSSYATVLQELSDRLLGLSTEAVATGIRDSLSDLGQLTKAARVYVFLLNDELNALDRAFEWCDDGVLGHDFSSFRGVPVTAFPWSMQQFLRDEVVYVRDARDLPTEADAEKGACSTLGIGSYVNVPLFLEGDMVGWLGFDADEPEPGWGEAEVDLMRAAGRMLVFTLDRIKREERLRAEQALSRRSARDSGGKNHAPGHSDQESTGAGEPDGLYFHGKRD